MKKLIITIVLIAVLTSCQKETPHQIKEDEGYTSIEITEVTMPSIVSFELEDVDFKKVINYEDVWVASYIDEGVSKILVFNEQGNTIYLQSNSSGSFSITQDKNDIYQLSYKNDLSEHKTVLFDSNLDVLYHIDTAEYVRIYNHDLRVYAAYVGDQSYYYMREKNDCNSCGYGEFELVLLTPNGEEVVFTSELSSFSVSLATLSDQSLILEYRKQNQDDEVVYTLVKFDQDGNKIKEITPNESTSVFPYGSGVFYVTNDDVVIYDSELIETSRIALNDVFLGFTILTDRSIIVMPNERIVIYPDGSWVIHQLPAIQNNIYIEDKDTMLVTYQYDLSYVAYIDDEEVVWEHNIENLGEVIVVEDLIYVGYQRDNKYFYQTYNFDGEIVGEEQELLGEFLLATKEGNIYVDYCDGYPEEQQQNYKCVSEIDESGNVIHTTGSIGLDKTVDDIGEGFIMIYEQFNSCSAFIPSQNCVITLYDHELNRVPLKLTGYAQQHYLYTDDGYIYIAVTDDQFGYRDSNVFMVQYDFEGNIINQYEITYLAYKALYYLDGEKIVKVELNYR